MNYTVEKLEKSQFKFSYVASADDFNGAVNSVYNRTKGKYSIPGFRKGHAPRKVIEGMYGPQVFFVDAVNQLVDDALKELSEDEKYEIVSADSVDDVDTLEDGGVKFTLVVSVRPEVKLCEYRGLGVAKKQEEVTEKDVDEYIGNQQLKQARLVELGADEPAQLGNTVTLDFVGRQDGVEFEGGSGKDQELELGSGSFIPGFEEQLVGAKAGETREVKVTFPENYGAEKLAGKEAVFTCDVKAVKRKDLPALDDEFAKDISEFSTFEEYKADVKATLEKEAQKRSEREYEDAIAEKLVSESEVEIPESMIEREAEEMVEEFKARLEYQGLKLEQYLDYVKMTKEDLFEEYKKTAQTRVKTRLVMEEVVKKEELTISEKEIDEKLAELAEQNSMTAEEYRKHLHRDDFDYVVNSIMSAKLIALLKERNEQPAPAAEETSKEAAPKKKPAKKSAKKAEGEEDKKAEEEPAADAQEAKPAKKTSKKTESASDGAEQPKKKAPAKKTAKAADDAKADAE